MALTLPPTPDIRRRLGLLILELEDYAVGLERITRDQERRSAQRLEGQIKTAKARKPKVPRVKKPPKVKVPKPLKIPRIKAPRKPRAKKVKHEMESRTT